MVEVLEKPIAARARSTSGEIVEAHLERAAVPMEFECVDGVSSFAKSHRDYLTAWSEHAGSV
jgi:hypothetical protein